MDNAGETALGQLAALQELDRRHRDRVIQLETLQGQIAELERQVAEQRTATQALRAERDALDQRRREMETHLTDEESKMKDRRMRLNRVRNEKELHALRREIEVSKEANQQLEEQLLQTMEALDALGTRLAEADAALAALDAQMTSTRAHHETDIATLTAEAAQAREERTRMATSLDAQLLRKYEQIFDRRGGVAVVEVRNGICLGCRMSLPPQLYNELQSSRDVRLCPNCHRILFWRPEALDDDRAER